MTNIKKITLLHPPLQAPNISIFSNNKQCISADPVCYSPPGLQPQSSMNWWTNWRRQSRRRPLQVCWCCSVHGSWLWTHHHRTSCLAAAHFLYLRKHWMITLGCFSEECWMMYMDYYARLSRPRVMFKMCSLVLVNGWTERIMLVFSSLQ